MAAGVADREGRGARPTPEAGPSKAELERIVRDVLRTMPQNSYPGLVPALAGLDVDQVVCATSTGVLGADAAVPDLRYTLPADGLYLAIGSLDVEQTGAGGLMVGSLKVDGALRTPQIVVGMSGAGRASPSKQWPIPDTAGTVLEVWASAAGGSYKVLKDHSALTIARLK